MKKNPDRIIDKLVYIQNDLDLKEMAHILAEYFQKNPFEVEQNLKAHFKLDKNTFESVENYTKYFKEHLGMLKEKDDLDTEKGKELIEFIFQVFEEEWEKILNDVTQKVSTEINQFK